MYPGTSENHRRAVCSDGGPVKLKNDATPQWPQPVGIFTDGSRFHVIPFLQLIHKLYGLLVEDGQSTDGLDTELRAFASMVATRTKKDQPEAGMVSFCLFEGLQVQDEASYASYINHADGKRWLRVDCLRD